MARALPVLLAASMVLGCEPGTSGACSPDPEEVWIVSELSFGRAEGRVAPGFDLDGIVGMQCGARDFTAPDGTPGIDNALAELLPLVEAQVGGLRLDSLVQNSIASGQILLAIQLAGVDDRTNDGCVGVRMRRLTGSPLLDAENRLLPFQTLYPDETTVINELGETRVTAGRIEPMPADLSLPVSILDARFTLDVRDAHLRLTYVGNDAIEGIVAGGIEVEQILAVVVTLNIPDDLMAMAELLIRSYADLVPMGRDCGQISAVLTFRAIPGFIGE
jgi:hypothetical protein